MPLPNTEGSQLFQDGWNQGSYIPCDSFSDSLRAACIAGGVGLVDDLQKQLSDKRNIIIFLSQACDIVARSDDLEPAIEFVLARKPKKANYKPAPYNLNGHSARFWEFQINETWYKADARKIGFIDKKALLAEVRANKLTPQHLSAEQREVLARWRANRYSRVALPSSFEEKIKPLVKAGLFDNNLAHCSSLYLNIDPFYEADSYTVRLFGLHRRGSPEDTFDSLFAAIEQILEKINGVAGLTCPYIGGQEQELFETVVPAMRRYELDIATRDNFVRWNLDYISIKDNDLEGIDENDL